MLFLLMSMMLVTAALFTSCNSKGSNVPEQDDPTKFSTSSIVGIWACVGSDNLLIDILTGKRYYDWDYDPNAETYKVEWYFNIQSDSKVKYIENDDEEEDYIAAEYRRSDGYLHIAENSKWSTVVDANYIFDVEHQAIRCPSGKIMGFTLESTADLLGSDTIFYVNRHGLDEATIIDNTGFIKSQYVIRAKGIKKDL